MYTEITSLQPIMDRCECDLGPTRKLTYSSLMNAEGVKVVEGSRMGIIARIDCVGSDIHGDYTLATIDGIQYKFNLDLVTNIQHCPSSRF